MTKRKLLTRVEQFRQAKAIHGGALRMCAAALGVRLSRIPIRSHRLRLMVYGTVFGKRYPSLNENELDRPLAEYPSLNALFTRGVRPECRPTSADAGQWMAACDGTVQQIGQIGHQQ